MTGFEMRQIAAPTAVPRATATQLRPVAVRPPMIANCRPFVSVVAVTTWTESGASPRRAEFAFTTSHFSDGYSHAHCRVTGA
jgi:hypothetical protein